MKYRATALCLILISLDFQSSLYCVRMRSTHFFNRRAVSYFCQSFSPCSHTHTHTEKKALLQLWGTCGIWTEMAYDEDGAWIPHLDPGTWIQHDVLDGALDVLCPRSQPGHLVVMSNLLPLCPGWRFRVLWVPEAKEPTDSRMCLDCTYTSKKQQHEGKCWCKINSIITSVCGSACLPWAMLLFSHMQHTVTGRWPLTQCSHVYKQVLALHLSDCRLHTRHVHAATDVSAMVAACFRWTSL